MERLSWEEEELQGAFVGARCPVGERSSDGVRASGFWCDRRAIPFSHRRRSSHRPTLLHRRILLHRLGRSDAEKSMDLDLSLLLSTKLLSVLFTFIVIKINLSTGIFPSLNVSAGLLGFLDQIR